MDEIHSRIIEFGGSNEPQEPIAWVLPDVDAIYLLRFTERNSISREHHVNQNKVIPDGMPVTIGLGDGG